MRRSLAWLVAVPLMLAGSEAAHALAYRFAYPDLHVRMHVLLVTGHGYLRWLPLVFGVAAAVVALSLVVAAVDAARGRATARAAGVGVRAAAAARVRRPGARRAAAAHRRLPVARVRHADVPAGARAAASVRPARLCRGAAPAPHGGARRPSGRAHGPAAAASRRDRARRAGGRAAPAAPRTDLPRAREARAASPRVRLSRPYPRPAFTPTTGENSDPQESYRSARARRHGGARRRGGGLRTRTNEPVRLPGERAAAVQPGGADREGEPDDDEDRAHGAAGLLDRLVRAEPRLDAGAAADRLGGQRRDPEGDVDRRERARPRRTRCSSSSRSRRSRGRTRSTSSRRTPTARSSTGRALSRPRPRRRRSRWRAPSAAGPRR